MGFDYIQYSNSIAGIFHKHNTNLFFTGGYDYKDLRQEANICAWKVVEKYKNEEQQKKIKFIIRGAVIQRLSEIKRDISRKISSGQNLYFSDDEIKERQKLKLSLTLHKYIDFIPLDVDKEGDIRLEKFNPNRISPEYLEAKTDDARFKVLLNIIRDKLTENEWKIFYGRVIESKTFKELNKTIKKKYSDMGIYKIYQKALQKARKIFKK